MAASALVVDHANGDAPTTDGIFSGLSFFLVQKLPSRSTFVNKIQSNGGRVVKLEAQADHIIADHVKPAHCPPASISFTFIDKALESGTLPDASEHSAGAPKGTVRPAATGSSTKGTRTPFTAEDDRELYLWVKKHEARGASVKGNELYKHLELRNGRHTWQAWRDRYIKRVHDKPPPGVDVEAYLNGDDANTGLNGRPKIVVGNEEFDEDDSAKLVQMGEDIEDIEADRVNEAWDAFAELWPEHSATSWRRLWEKISRPRYLRRLKIQKKKLPLDKTYYEVNNADDRKPREVEKTTSTPGRPQSPSSLKRKRRTPTPRKQTMYGRKKQKESNEIFGDAGSDDENLANGQPPAMNHAAPSADQTGPSVNGRHSGQHQSPHLRMPTAAADEGNDRRQRESSGPSTSDANKAAAMQLDDEYQRLLAEAMPPVSQEEDVDGQTNQIVAEGPLITSDANKAAAMQLDDDYERLPAEPTPQASQQATAGSTARGGIIQNATTRQPRDETVDAVGLVTSELNHDADDQLRRETRSRKRVKTDTAIVPTSDLNHPADQQLRRESVESDAGHGRTSAFDSQHDTMLHSEAIASQVGDDDHSNLVHARGDALTEANLATQDEQHREPLVRGKDLPQDDEMQDQSDFVQYLQNLQRDATGKGQSGLTPEAQDVTPSAPAPDLGPTPRSREAHKDNEALLSEQHSMHDPIFDGLPLSSQQELDQILTDTLQWPESPRIAKANQLSQQQSQEPSTQFETQAQYPRLPSQQLDKEVMSPQGPKEIRYPDLDDAIEQPKAKSYAENLQARFDREVLGLEPPKHHESDQNSDVEQSQLHGHRNGSAEGEIGLEIPEPEGGFGFSFSQLWPSQQPLEAEQQSDIHVAQQDLKIPQVHDQNDDEELELEALEPKDGFGFTSSPPKGPQHAHRSPSQGRRYAAHQQQQLVANGADGDDAVAAPPGAAIEITSSSSSSSSEADPEPEQDEGMPLDYPRTLETQDMYNAETQAPDFNMPSPDAGPDDDCSSDPLSPNRPSVQESQAALVDTQTLSDDDVEEYINRMMFMEKHNEEAILDALKCTSSRPDLAELVLLESKLGKGLPAVPGVWSEEEDVVLEGGNARALRMLEEKHGWKECEARMLWLQQYREDDEDEEEG